MKHLLIVAFHFPPESSSSGVLRTLKFSRYLLGYGWRSTVISPSTAAYAVVDASLENQIPEAVHVIRTPFVELRARLAIFGKYPAMLAVPDAWIGWYPYAVRAGRALAKHDQVDAVLSTSPHPTAHLVARSLARSLAVPLVVDFRDPWYEVPPETGTPTIVRWSSRLLERRVVTAASHVVASTVALRDMLRARYSSQSSSKFSTITNGYDEADFASFNPSNKSAAERMVILHAGSINPNFRDPRPVLESIGRLIKAGEIGKHQLAIRFLGAGSYADSAAIATTIASSNLEGVVQFLPRVEYGEGLAAMSDADLLLLLQASEDTRSLVPAKLYEYLRANRPVLAIVQPGATDDLMKSVGGGWSCDPESTASLDAVIGEIVRLWRSRQLDTRAAPLAQLKRFDRQVLAGQLATILDGAVSRRTNANDAKGCGA